MAISLTTTQLGATSINFTKYLAGKITKTDRYKDSTLLDFALTPTDAAFVRLVRGAYITVNSSLYPKVFTGYITNEPSLTYLGQFNHAPVWGYVYQASSDEYILNLKPVGIIPTFTNVSMGFIIKQLVARLVPNTFDVLEVQDGPLVAQYTPDSTKKFQDVINEFEESASYRFYANDKKLYFVPQDAAAMGKVTIDGNNKHFTPSRLDIRPASSGAAIANDVTVVGSIEPQAYVTEYFVGTGLDAKFSLASGVFGADSSVLLDELFPNSSVDSSKWDVYDTASLWLQVGNGYLNVQGGSGNASFDVRLQSKSLIPLDGKLRLTHGDWRLTSGAGYICGLWTQTPNSFNTGCVYSLYYGSNTLRPVISGAVDNAQTMVVSAANRYVIRTVAEFTKTNRTTQQYNYLASNGTVSNYGGTAVDDTVVWHTLISEINSAGDIVQQVTFRNTASLSSATVYARYIPAASDNLNAAFTGITISVPVDASLETATKLPLLNANFEDWVSSGNVAPTDWTTTTASYIWRESSIVDSGYSMKMLGDGAAMVEQPVNTMILPSTAYTIMARLRKSASMTGTITMSLVGTGVNQAFSTAISSLSSTAFQYAIGTLTAGITSVPTDLQLRISVSGGAVGQAVYVDSVQVMSAFEAQLVGPNEMDGLDGVAPIATIVSQSSDSKSSYLGTPQYNPGQSELVFFKDSTTLTSNVPPANQIIKLRYRSAGPSLGRAINRVSAATESANWGDDGVRSIVRTDVVPTPRTSEECELAAAAVVTENSRAQYEGTYEQWSEYFSKEPKAGAAIEFINLSNMAAVSVEEINEVVTTIESEKPIERFNHRLSFGKTSAATKLLGKIGSPAIGFQRAAGQAQTQPVDIQAVAANAAYASDIRNPSLVGWAANTISIDLGEDLTASDLYFEVRYTDEGWGVDDGLNLISRTTSRSFIGPRNLRGRTYFMRKARKGNHILWSEDQTNATVYTGVTSKANELGPDGQLGNVSSATLPMNGVIVGTVSGLSGTTFCGTVSVLAPAGKLMRLSFGASLKDFTATGYWQRVSVTQSGTVPTSLSLSYIGTGSALVKTTKWSVEESAAETFYAKTTSIKYGPTSRYSSLIRVSFPFEDTTAAEGFVAPPTSPTSCSQSVEEFGDNFVVKVMLILPTNTGTTTGYNTQLNFYTNPTATISETGWVDGPDISSADLTEAKTPPWPKSDGVRYVRSMARAINGNNEVGPWVESVAGAGSTISAKTVVTSPTQPISSDWTIANPSALLGDYAANEFHEQMVRLTPLVVNLPAGASFMTFWLYKGATRPNNPGDWVYITDSLETTSVGTWFPQPKTAQTWLVCATASKPTWNQIPTDTTPYVSVSIAAWTRPTAITGVSVPAHTTKILDGVRWFDGTVNYTANLTDANYAYTAIDSAWVNPLAADNATVAQAWVEGTSKWERIKEIRDSGPWVSGPYKAGDGGRRYLRIYSVGHSDVRGAEDLTDAVYVLSPREPIQIGFDATILGRGIAADSSGRIEIVSGDSDNMVLNPGWENGTKDHTLNNGAYVVTDAFAWSGSSSLILSTDNAIDYASPIPVKPGDELYYEIDLQNSVAPNLPTAALWLGLVMLDKNKAWFSSGASDVFSSAQPSATGALSKLSLTAIIPSGVSYVMPSVNITTVLNGGHYRIDNMLLRRINSIGANASVPAGLTYNLTGPITDSNGIASWYFYAQWGAETATASRSRLEFDFTPTSPARATVPLGSAPIGDGSVGLLKQPYENISITGTFKGYVVSKDGVRSLVFTSAGLVIPAGSIAAPVAPTATPPANLHAHATITTQPYYAYQTANDANGMSQWYLHVKWDAETVTAQRTNLVFEYALADASWLPTTSARPLGRYPISSNAVDLPPQPYFTTQQNALLRVMVESKDGKLTTAAELHFIIPAGTTVAPTSATATEPTNLSVNFTGPVFDVAGVAEWYFWASWTGETVTASRAKLEFEWDTTSPNRAPVAIGSRSIADSSVDLMRMAYEATSMIGNVLVYVVSKDNVRTLSKTIPFTIAAGPANRLRPDQLDPAYLLGLTKQAGTGKLMPDVTTDFVIDATTGKLTQLAVDLSKSYGFDTSELEKAPTTNALRIKTLAVNKLIAGTALFAGDVTFARNNGFGGTDSSVLINNAGAVIAKYTRNPSTGVVSMDSSITLTASGVVISRASSGGVVTIDSNGVLITKGTSSVNVASDGVTIVNGILQSPDITVTGSTFVVDINTTQGILVTRTLGGYAQIIDGTMIAWSSTYSSEVTSSNIAVSVNANPSTGSYIGTTTTAASMGVQYNSTSNAITVRSNSSANTITSSRASSYVDFSGSDNYIQCTGSGSYIKSAHFRFPALVNGTKYLYGVGTALTGWFLEVCDPNGTVYYVPVYQ